MKKAPVVIKGNKSGIRIVLDDALPFPEILEESKKNSRKVRIFLARLVAVSFDGRKLLRNRKLFYWKAQGKFKITSRVSD